LLQFIFCDVERNESFCAINRERTFAEWNDFHFNKLGLFSSQYHLAVSIQFYQYE
jgi:hypothetical protein